MEVATAQISPHDFGRCAGRWTQASLQRPRDPSFCIEISSTLPRDNGNLITYVSAKTAQPLLRHARSEDTAMSKIESVSVCVARVPLDRVTSFAPRTVRERDYCLVQVRDRKSVVIGRAHV